MTTIQFGNIRADGRFYSEAVADLETKAARRFDPDSIQTHLCGKCSPRSATFNPESDCPNWIVNA